jgi:lysophospholipase L1-like esterase
MHGRLRAVLVGTLVAGLLTVGGPAAAEPLPARTATVPTAMASLGDSITRGFNACQLLVECLSRSWSTGASNGVTSHFVRLQAIDKRMKSRTNLARSGAEADELAGQAQAAVGLGVGYVTILIGANDACASTEAGMTSVESFAASVEAALDVLAAASTPPLVLVATIPDLEQLWRVGRTSFSAVSAWSLYSICPTMLANPLSNAQADVDRRTRVRERVIAYNAVLMDACAARDFCRHDGGTVFAYPFALADLSGWDYFHPSARGQDVLAAETWRAGYSWVKAGGGGGGGGGDAGGGGGKKPRG